VSLVPLRAFAAPFSCGVALCLLALLGLPASAQAQLPGSGEATPDSIAQRLGLPDGHSPRAALQRSLMVPGWGQYYNRQYWKIPVAVVGFGGAVAALVYNWDRYFLYRNAWRFAQQPDVYPQHEDVYNQLQAIRAAFGDDILKDRREQFRRWGEFAIVGTGLFWIFQVADAYVSAHLLGFDIGDELSMQVAPGREGLAVKLRLSL
jgi:hypothetical protein